MALVNSLLRPVFDLLQRPFEHLPSLVGITVWSIPVAIFALWIFKRFSNQDRISEVKRRIQGCLFEIRLFNDDLRAIMRAQAEILKHVLHYQWLAFKPMIWILPPLVLIMVHLHMFYGFSPLETDQHTMLTATLKPDAVTAGQRPDVQLELPEGVQLESPAVWATGDRQMSWRLSAWRDGHYELGVRLGDAVAAKSLQVGGGIVRLSPERPDHAFMAQLEFPSEPPLDAAGPFQRITVGYPEARTDILGWHMQWQFGWMVVFFVLTMVIAFALKGPMGVEL